jgi:hypothetical protein
MVIRAISVTASVLLMCGFKREVPVPVQTENHPAVQAEGVRHEDDAAQNEEENVSQHWNTS